MRHGKTFRKRFLTFLLSLAMVFTSVNVPMLTVRAEEETPIENGNIEMLTTDDGSNELTTPEDGDEGTPENDENPVGGGINPITEASDLAAPAGVVAEYWTVNDEHKGMIRVVFQPVLGATGYKILVDGVEACTGSDTEQWLDKTFSEGQHEVTVIALGENGAESAPSVVTDPSKFTVPGATETKAPSKPSGVEARYWDTDDANNGKIWVTWNSVFGDGGIPTSWKVSIDGKLVGTESNVAAYFYENTYAAGTHTVGVVASNSIGDSEPTTVSFTLTADQAGGSDAGEGDPIGTGDTLVNPSADLTGIVAVEDATVMTNGWNAWTNAGIAAKGEANSTVTFTYPSGKCTTDYALQFQTEEKIEITEGEYYTLTFTAESSIPRYMEVCMGCTPANYARYNDLIYKLPEKQETEVIYVFKATNTATCKLQFLLGTRSEDKSPLWEQESGHTLKLSNISLVKGKTDAEEGANAAVATDAYKTGLKAAIKECEALKAEEYEEESFKALTTALTTAKSVSESASSTKKAVDDVLTDLQIAKASLHESGYVPPADPVTMADPINFEEVSMWTFSGGEGASNVQFKYDKTRATITADNFGWGEWAVQWSPAADLESPVDNNVFEFDVVSTIDKSFVYKNEKSNTLETIDLKANEIKHIARRINGKSFDFTFDLTGGGAGTLTFTDMKFGEEVSFYNFKEQETAGNLKTHFGSWAEAVATGSATEDSYTINASNFGNAEWGIQLILNNFINITTTSTYKIGATIESTVDKEITVKLGNPSNENDELALKKVSLKADTPQTIELESILWDKELASTLYFACGGGGNSGDITISKLYVVTKKPTTKDAPVLTAGKKNDKANGYRIGEAVELNYNEGAADWAKNITAITVNNKPLSSDRYTLSETDHKITVNADVFTKYDVYDFVITAENYQDVKIRVPVYAVSVNNEDWQQEWADEFNGTELDSSKWDYEIGIRSGDDTTSNAAIYWGNNEKQYYTKEAVTVQDGKLVVTATALTDDLKAKYNITDTHVKYSSGRIRTVSEDGSEVKFGTTYGRMEAKMELPKATGYWPAFWGLPTPETMELYGTWAASGEIDIMEAVGQDGNYVNGTIHYGSEWPNNVYSGGSHYFEEDDSIANEHVYAIEWEPGEIRWYVDDILYHVENNWYAKANGASANYAYPAPFDEDFYLLLNLAVSGNYVGNQDPAADELGKSMKVDYVRVYKDSTKDYGTTPDAPSADKDTEFFEANKVNADESGNYIKDPEFETMKDHQMAGGTTVVPGLGYWTTATDSGNGAATDIAVADKDGVKYAKINVLATGANNYDIQLIQHVPLAKGYTYKLTFDAYTDVPAGRNFTIAPKGDADNGWAGYDSGINPNLTAEVQSFEHIFKMTAASDPTARIEMNIGNALGTVYVGNVKLVALTDQEVEDIENEKLHGKKTPLDNGEHVYNGTFDQGKNRLEYWDLDGDYTADTSKRSMKAVIKASSDINDAIIKQTGLQLLARDNYRLTLTAKADAAKEIKVGLYSKEGVAYAEKSEKINTETKKVVLEFTMPANVTDEEAILIIAFGGNTVPVEIDNVSMIRTTNFNAEWNASILYPLGGETWSDYNYYVFGNVTGKAVPADGIVTEEAKAATNNYDYMIFRNASVKTGYSYDLSFDIMTSVANQKVIASVQQDDTWIELAHEKVTTGTDWQTVNATFKATTEGAVNLKFLLSDSSNTEYKVSLKNVSLKTVGAPYLVIEKLPSELSVGAKFQVNASHAVDVNPDYEVYTYSSSNPDVATISESGLITAVAVGTTTIKVTSGVGATKSFDVAVVEKADDYSEVGYRVTFNYNCELGTKTIDVEPGALITDMAEITAVKRKGYSLQKTWYKDAEYKKEWNFETDTVQADTTLYALWLTETPKSETGLGASSLIVQEIRPVTYTGSALKPSVIVYANVVNKDGRTERVQLKANKDYKVTYKNNVNVYQGKDDPKEPLVRPTAYTDSTTKPKNLWSYRPYVEIKGNGSYSGYVYQEFEILPADINAATLKYNSQIVEGKTAKVVTSLKYKKALKEGTDYHVEVVRKADDEKVAWTTYKDPEKETTLYKAATIASAKAGLHKMEIKGKGNYTGTVTGDIFVAGNTQLMQKATVSIGAKAKKQDWTGEEIELISAYEVSGVNATTIEGETKPKNEVYTVKLGGKLLKEGRDFEANYENNKNVGTATITLTGRENRDPDAVYCTGTKTVTFQITGKKFVAAGNGKTVVVKEGETTTDGKKFAEAAPYTGKPVTKSGIVLEDTAGNKLVLGKDYNITYKNNLKKGKATVTFTATQRSGYTGKFAMTFQIGEVDLNEALDDENGITGATKKNGVWTVVDPVPYTPAGAKLPAITLKNKNGVALKEKTDYTITYIKGVNYKQVTTDDTKDDSVAVTLNGKGNYTGSLTVNFKIRKATVNDLTITTKAVQYKDSTAAYAPAVTVKNGKTTLKAKGNGQEYEVEYVKCDKASVDKYIAYRNGVEGAEKADAPTAIITLLNGSNYDTRITKTVTLTIFQKSRKLTAKKVTVNFIDKVHYYEGGLPIRPRFESIIFDMGGGETVDLSKDVAVIRDEEAGRMYREYLNYDITWGANNKTGNGTMKITGKGIYTGTVTVKFKIEKKPVNTKKPQNLIVDRLTYDYYIDALIQADLVEALGTAKGYVDAKYDAALNTAEITIQPEADVLPIEESIDKWIKDNDTPDNRARLNALRWDAQNAFAPDLEEEVERIDLELKGEFDDIRIPGLGNFSPDPKAKSKTIEDPKSYIKNKYPNADPSTATDTIIDKVREKYKEMYKEMVAEIESRYEIPLEKFGDVPTGTITATATIVYSDGTTLELEYKADVKRPGKEPVTPAE